MSLAPPRGDLVATLAVFARAFKRLPPARSFPVHSGRDAKGRRYSLHATMTGDAYLVRPGEPTLFVAAADLAAAMASASAAAPAPPEGGAP